MKFSYKYLLFVCSFAVSNLTSTPPPPLSIKSEPVLRFNHNIQLQLYDWYGVPVPGTEFWVTIKVLKEGSKVTLQLPGINFQTGQFANNPYEAGLPIPPYIPGGYLYTSDGYLPANVRPTDLVNRSWLVPTDNGVLFPFSFTQDSDTLPNPIAGYILQVTNAGGLVIQGAGTWGNIIPEGNQTMLPTTISYIVEPTSSLARNIPLSTGATTTTQEPAFFQSGAGLRDFHINDAYNGIAAWAWVDNSMVADKTNSVMNLMVAIGQQDEQGRLKIAAPLQLTDLQPPFSASFDTAVAINRVNSDNIIVSYSFYDLDAPSSNPFGITGATYRAVSFDGGKTWPAEYNGPTNIQPNLTFLGDNPGVASDKYGNIWYVATNYFDPTGTNLINQPYFMVSTDGGITYTLIYTAPLPPLDTIDDFPQYCFGKDDQGNYGLYFTYHNTSINAVDVFPSIGFIPIMGLGQFGLITTTDLTQFTNNDLNPDIAASMDGRIWLYGYPAAEVPGIFPAPMSGINSMRVIYKSPGSLAENYAGPLDFSTTTFLNESLFLSTDISEPIFGYFNSARTIIYDDNRQALYAITKTHVPQAISNDPDQNQNMQIYFAISRDNGATWSSPIAIATTDFANRGFQTMALDTVTGNLVFGWYDGRNDPTYESVEYYAAIITAQQLDQLIAGIPLSDPVYVMPAATGIIG